MDTITLEQIEALARTESVRLEYYFLGVEHLFLALLKLGGLTNAVLARLGVSADVVRDALLADLAKGEEDWLSVTPRAAVVLGATREHHLNNPHSFTAEEALLYAILEEGDSIPVRLLQDKFEITREKFIDVVSEFSKEVAAKLPEAAIEFSGLVSSAQIDGFDEAQRAVLSKMFGKYARVRIERFFSGGYNSYSGALVMLVRPYYVDGRADHLAVVKMHDPHTIAQEKRKYEEFVRDKLPLKAASIQGEIVQPAGLGLAGLKYPFIGSKDAEILNIARLVEEYPPEEAARLLRQTLFNGFSDPLWGESTSYQFRIWQEYEMLLPPVLSIEVLGTGTLNNTTRKLEHPGDWSFEENFYPGEIIRLENAKILKVADQSTIRVSNIEGTEAEKNGKRIVVGGLTVDPRTAQRDQTVRPIVGRVTQTRDDVLQECVQALEPDFLLTEPRLPGGLPNPLTTYRSLLRYRMNGRKSTIHGDMHIGNVLLMPDTKEGFLIDFEFSRDGHYLFDWAILETSLLIDHVTKRINARWESVRDAAREVSALADSTTPRGPLADVLRPAVEIRQIVGALQDKNGYINPAEYQIALAFCALRVITWQKLPLVQRRLAFWVSAGAMSVAVKYYDKPTGDNLTVADTGNPTI
jgi:Ternary complex associated domain 9/Clp amino terminal domain, pathogenicity island component